VPNATTLPLAPYLVIPFEAVPTELAPNHVALLVTCVAVTFNWVLPDNLLKVTPVLSKSNSVAKPIS
jgi:hypothetical protein